MNNKRRAAIRAIAAKLKQLSEEIESIRDDEQDYFDNMPENLQGSERGEIAENAIDALDEASSNLEEAIGNLENAAE